MEHDERVRVVEAFHDDPEILRDFLVVRELP
jgi:hypothetical protein